MAQGIAAKAGTSVRIFPTQAWALVGRGRVYQQIGEYDKALNDFTRAIELDSDPYA